MNSLNQIDDHGIPLQTKVFSRWILFQIDGLSRKNIEDITKNFSKGLILCDLAENLTKRQTKKTNDSIQNFEIAIDMFEKDGVKNIEKSKNFDNANFIHGLIWTLILHYSIEKSVLNEKSQIAIEKVLLSWAVNKIKSYPNIEGFHPYELILCALLDQYFPEKICYKNLDSKNCKQNFLLATNVMKEVGIPVYVYPEDLENNSSIDEKALLTQLSAIKFALDNCKNNLNKLDSEYESFILTNSQPSITISDSYASSSSMFSYDDSQLFSNIDQTKADSLLITGKNNNERESDYDDDDYESCELIMKNEEKIKSTDEFDNKKLSFKINSQENLNENVNNQEMIFNSIDDSIEEQIDQIKINNPINENIKEQPCQVKNFISINNDIKEQINQVKTNENKLNNCNQKNKDVVMNAEDKFLINTISFSNFAVDASRNIRDMFQKISIKKLNQKSRMNNHHLNLFKIHKKN